MDEILGQVTFDRPDCTDGAWGPGAGLYLSFSIDGTMNPSGYPYVAPDPEGFATTGQSRTGVTAAFRLDTPVFNTTGSPATHSIAVHASDGCNNSNSAHYTVHSLSLTVMETTLP